MYIKTVGIRYIYIHTVLIYILMYSRYTRNISFIQHTGFPKEIKSKSLQTQLNSIYYTELQVSTYFRSSSGSQFVFKTYLGTNISP